MTTFHLPIWHSVTDNLQMHSCEEGICSNIGLTIHPALALKCSRICFDNVHYVLPFVKQTDKTAG